MSAFDEAKDRLKQAIAHVIADDRREDVQAAVPAGPLTPGVEATDGQADGLRGPPDPPPSEA